MASIRTSLLAPIGQYGHGGKEDLDSRIRLAYAWIETAYHAAGDGGISKGYDTLRGRWNPSYPETTGYTIPTLLNVSRAIEEPDIAKLARSLSVYLMKCRTAEGGVSHWAAEQPNPIVFDTGQVIFGWVSAHRHFSERAPLEAAIKGALWLSNIQEPSGRWEKGQHLGVPKVIDARVAWALLELFRITGDEKIRETAVKQLDWVLENQEDDGWFRQCAFTSDQDPFTHTLAYTAEGLYESGKILNEAKYIEAGLKAADSLLLVQKPNGRLDSTYRSGWRPGRKSSCLTGNCQMARLWMVMGIDQKRPHYVEAGRKALSYVHRYQNRESDISAIRGAIPGSAPFFGLYERFQYPNWATKFYLDALLVQRAIELGEDLPQYMG